jgi:hypothetical protein
MQTGKDKIVKKTPGRVVIYPKDIVNITGVSIRTAQRMLQSIRLSQGKTKEQFVTINEFCLYCAFDEDYVREYIT